jgi:ADP-ribosylglycohydrolase
VLGAIAGDVIGSVWEGRLRNPRDVPLFTTRSAFTDDTVCTIAVAEWILSGAGDDLATIMRGWVRRYPGAGYGGLFVRWAISRGSGPYGSWGNGGAMRAAPCGWAGQDKAEVLDLAARSARITHDHPQGVKLRPTHKFDVSAAGTLPVALSCALHAVDFEEAMRHAIWLGGDTDTIACIAGAVAEALLGLPAEIGHEARARLDAPVRAVADRFEERYGCG